MWQPFSTISRWWRDGGVPTKFYLAACGIWALLFLSSLFQTDEQFEGKGGVTYTHDETGYWSVVKPERKIQDPYPEDPYKGLRAFCSGVNPYEDGAAEACAETYYLEP